jgi:hypothetical protein
VRCLGPARAQWVVGTSSRREVSETVPFAVGVGSMIENIWEMYKLSVLTVPLLSSLWRKARLQSWGKACR